MNKLLILSYANKKNINLHNYINSLKKYNYNYKIIGNGEKWINFITKINGYYNYLSNYKDNSDLICITDSYDVLACGPPEELINKFLSFNKDIVFSSETNCTSGKCIYLSNYYKINENNMKNTKNKYLNSGFIIGKKKSILELLQFILNESESSGIMDDQFICCLYVQKNSTTNIALDTECKLMGTICYNIFDYEWINNRIHNKYTNQYVCFIHCPCMNSDFSYRLDYFGSKILKQKYIKDSIINKFKNFISHVKSVSNLKLYFIIILLIFIILFYFNYKIVLILIGLLLILFIKLSL